MIACLHENFAVTANVARLADEDKPLRFMLDVEVLCLDCNKPFMFTGIDIVGFAFDRPSVGVSRTILALPIAPWDRTVATSATYRLHDEDAP